MSKKILSLVLALIMVVACFAGCAKENTDNTDNTNTVKNENKVIIGSTTDLSGDFRWPGFGGSSAGASDQDVNKLTTGYSTMETNQGGAYVWNNTAVKSHTETETADGNLEIVIEINPGLKFSDGTEVKAANYLAYVLAFSSPVSVGAGHTGKSGLAFVGFDAYSLYNGTNDGQEVKKTVDVKDEEGNVTGTEEVTIGTASKVFSGVRLLGDYKFSITIDAAKGYYPYYYANTYGAVTPYDIELVLGTGVEVKDDGQGAYLTDAFYAKATDGSYTKAQHIKDARYDWNTYAFSGPYTISDYNDSTKEATLTLNPNFAGNFEGQKPSIQTVVYTKVVNETQLDQLKSGAVDILSGISGGEDTRAALAVVDESNGSFSEVHYQRAGYGKVQFECDFGPTMFASVRQALAYALDLDSFCSAYTEGYGTIVYGPYTPDFDMWKAVGDDIELTEYAFSIENAKKALVDGGWIYNADGSAYVDGSNKVRYKKLTAAEATDYNIAYKTVQNTDGNEYMTVKVGDDYYMPCAINYFGTSNNPVTEMLITRLVGTENITALGMVVRSFIGDFDTLLGNIYRDETQGYVGPTPTYGMYNLATGWNSAIYDYSFNWSLDPEWLDYSVNKLFDEYDEAFPYYDANGNHTKMTYEQAMTASGGKLGMDYLSMAMVYDATTTEEYNQWWMAYIERWNKLLPDIPLYSNYYFDIYNSKIQNFSTSPLWGAADAVLYCTIANVA